MWARIENGLVAELTDIDPEGRFHRFLTWEPCSPDVALRWVFANGEFSAPAGDGEQALSASERAWRDAEFASIVWLRDRHRDQLELGVETTLTAEQFTDLLAYMQALRDWPQSGAFPGISQRPSAPPWFANPTQ